MIKAENLRKEYSDLIAVDGVSFEIAAGETFGFLGPNGAGKSTTINMLAGVLAPDSGEVAIDDETDPTRPEVRRKLGLAPQALALYDELTAIENVSFFGSLYGVRGATLRERVAWSLDFVGLTDRGGDRAKTYSGGMSRRLNLACALVHGPPVLLLDEPTVGVDPQSRNLIFDKVEELKATGRTLLYTTHYMEEAERLCDRVAIIDQGRILAMGAVDDLIAEHGGDSIVDGELAETPASPDNLPGELEGNRLRVQTREPLEVVGQLAGAGINFKTLKIERANLEAVFLNLTGRRLRD